MLGNKIKYAIINYVMGVILCTKHYIENIDQNNLMK